MLRPATPLSILFFAAFVLLLLSTLSTPIIKAIPLATYKGVKFGVLGYCDGDKCFGPMIGYDTEDLFVPDSEFSLPRSARHALSSILVVHPVAALMTLVCCGLAFAAHFHSPSHSPRYLLALLILTFPTLLISLLAFLVDILLFVPHLAWGGWIVLGATILIVASGVVTCAMRRTLVSRKARKRRIAENAEMNGQNYYANRAATTASGPAKPDSPPLSGDTMTSGRDKLPEFTSYELQKQKTPPSEDMTPLNPRDPSVRTNSSNDREGSDRALNPSRGPSGRGRQAMDQYGNPIPPMPNDGFAMRNQQPRMGPPPPNRGGPQMFGRGRGGYPPRGAYGPQRGGYPPRGGMRAPPPPGWNGMRPGMGPGPGPMQGPGPGGRGFPPPGYQNDPYAQGLSAQREPSPYDGSRGVPPSAPLALGQAVHMAPTPPSNNNQNYGLRESDDDVQGMLALQQGGFAGEAPPRRPSVTSPTSDYSQGDTQYVPPRANWNQNSTPSDSTVPTMNGNNSRGLSPIQDRSPVELPTERSVVGAPSRTSDYYEDVDPKFAEHAAPTGPIPSSLLPGGFSGSNPNLLNASNNQSVDQLPRNTSYDDLPEGARSPAASDVSHFTSVSQRGVNPNWRPPPPGMGGPPLPGQYAPYGRGRPMRQGDAILEANAANPDFVIPGAAPGRGRGRGRGGRGGRGGPIPPF